MRAFTPIAVDAAIARLVDRIAAAEPSGPALRVALDGPPGPGRPLSPVAAPAALAAAVVEPLQARGCRAHLIDARTFWRDASLRLEFGREDVESFATWLDSAALRREVLDPLGPGGTGRFLPSLRDPVTNRATRAPAESAGPGAVVIVHGALLLGAGLPFDLSVHLATSSAARARRTPTEQAWTLPAYERYESEADPTSVADVVIRIEDPLRPAIGISTSS